MKLGAIGYALLVSSFGFAGADDSSPPIADTERYELIEIDCGASRVEVRPASDSTQDTECPTRTLAYMAANQSVPSLEFRETQPQSFLPNKLGWPLRLDNVSDRSPGLAHLGNQRGLATIFHEIDGAVHAILPDTQPVWKRRVLLGSSFNSTSPAVADLDEDGRQEILISVGDLYALSETGTVLPGWPLDLSPDEGFFPPPIITRFELQGPLRVVAASGTRLGEGRVHLLDKYGRAMPGWPVSLPPATFKVGPAIAVGDVTGDAVADVVVVDGANRRTLIYDYAGQLVTLSRTPTAISGRPDIPTLGDLDGDGVAEIVFRVGFRVLALNADGSIVPGWPQEMVAGGNFGVALGDVDSDGELEVMASTVNGSRDFEGGVYVWNGDGTLLSGWPKLLREVSFAAPTVIADVDGDGQGDLIASGLSGFLTNGTIYAWKSSGELIPGFPFVLNGQWIFSSAPLVADIDRDGRADLGVMTRTNLTTSFMHWFDLGVPYRPEGMEWPVEGHDMGRTGAYSPPVKRRLAQVRLSPGVVQSGTPVVPLTAVVTLPAGSGLVPDTLRLVEVDGVPVSGVLGLRLGGAAVTGTFVANKAVYRFDGPAVRDLLGGLGVHELLFQSDILGDGVMYEAETDLTLR